MMSGKIQPSADYTNVDVFTTVSFVALGVEPCTAADMPFLSADVSICPGNIAELSVISGNLNDAVNWFWYTGDCGAVSVGVGTHVFVMPAETTTYYVREEAFCDVPGACASVTVTVHPLPQVQCQQGFCITADEQAFLLRGAQPAGGVYVGAGVITNKFNESFFSPAEAGEGTHVIRYYYVDPVTGCQDSCTFAITVVYIPYKLHVQDSVIDFGDVVCYNACKLLSVQDFTAKQGSVSRFIAGKQVISYPGAQFKQGTYMHAYISTNGIFCEDVPLVASKNKEEHADQEIYEIGNQNAKGDLLH